MRNPAPHTPAEADDAPALAAVEPHFSLLRLSAGQRLLGAAAILAILWLAVWWAL
jgi:hypothetical protein